MMRAVAVALSVALVSGCAGKAPSPAPVTPGPPPPVTAPPPPSDDQCGAGDMQSLIGRPRGAIPVPVLPSLQRVSCRTCPVSQDYNPRRLNFIYDAQTGLVEEVNCG